MTLAMEIWRRWITFWFAPADPTPIGFMRIVTGCLVVYVHLAYIGDLRSFFGADGWYALEYANREREEVPYIVPPAGWEAPPVSATLPEIPHRRKAVMAYIRSLSDNKPSRAELDPALKFLDRLQATGNNGAAQDGLRYVSALSPVETFRRNQLAAVVDPTAQVNDPVRLPDFLSGLSLEERKKCAEEIDAFYRTLPIGDTAATANNRNFVLNHLAVVDIAQRAALLQFVRDLTAVTPDERAKRLDYLEYWGYEARYVHRLGNPIFSLWFHLTDPTAMAVAHGVILVIMVMFTLGIFTRVTSILTWLAALSYIHRTQQVLFGMDTMMNLLLFYLMIGPSGAALSIDRLWNRYRAIRAGLARGGKLDPPAAAYLTGPPATPWAGFGLRLIQIHFCFIYMASGLSKLKGASWWNTTAYWDTLANPEFTLIHYHWYESLVRLLVSSRPVYAALAFGGVAVTFVAELGLPFLVWTRARPYILVIAFLLHAGIAVFMGLWIFSLLMMTLMLCYIPGYTIRERLFGSALPIPHNGPRSKVAFQATDPGQARIAAIARSLDDSVEFTTGTGPAAVMTTFGKSYNATAMGIGVYLAVANLVGTVFARPLASLFGFRPIAGK